MIVTSARLRLRGWVAIAITGAVVASPFVASSEEPQPVTKMCIVVGGVLRQTSDPNSPPCVPYYQGENGGATWQGVTEDEIKVVIYLSAATTSDANGVSETPPAGTYCDVDLLDCDGDGLQDEDAHAWMRVANAYSRYFNQRFQTYGRHVHAYIYWSSAQTPAARRADAADNWETLHPFATLNQATFGGHHETYSNALALRQTMVFGNLDSFPRAFFQDNAPFLWDWWPDAESYAHQFVSYVCSKVAGTKVTSGQFAGEDRRYALYSSSDPSNPQARFVSRLVKKGLEDCGVEVTLDATFPHSGWGVDTEGDRTYAARNVARMSARRINTILWAGGSETDTSKFADLALYSPEWVVLGDGKMDALSYARSQGQASWSNAWTMSARPRVGDRNNDPAYLAYREAEPEGLDVEWASEFYTEWFLFFTAIQVTGPTLTPSGVEQALRAMPATASTSPYAVSGNFPAGGFTFVKDANEGWWDSSEMAPDGELGCYRLVSEGARRLSGDWATATGSGLGSGGQERSPLDPCNGFDRSRSIRPGVPTLGNLPLLGSTWARPLI